VSAAPHDPVRDEQRLAALARLVADDVVADLSRQADQARNEARRVVIEAEDQMAGLERAARELGRRRGAAVEGAASRAGEREAEEVTAEATHQLAERFLARVKLGLAALPGTPRHATALRAWAAEAAAKMDRPADVFVEGAHRAAVYDALLAEGARDFRIHADPRVHVGFVVRDLDGRTLLDRRPEALVQERRTDLLALLSDRVTPPPSTAAPPPA
jgi:vacuolar-type H+-ATPase subunit E/Vma4